jgi:Domain of unknown function (DUF4304)
MISLDRGLDTIIGTTAARVANLGFVRRGSILRVAGNGTSGVIQFQKSTGSTKDLVRFTISLAVVCGALLEEWQPATGKATSTDAHLRERVGMLMPTRTDKWWEITSATNVDAVATEVSDLVATVGAPYVMRYLDTEELVALWQSGQSPGLTETQRVRYLEKLGAQQRGTAAEADHLK